MYDNRVQFSWYDLFVAVRKSRRYIKQRTVQQILDA